MVQADGAVGIDFSSKMRQERAARGQVVERHTGNEFVAPYGEGTKRGEFGGDGANACVCDHPFGVEVAEVQEVEIGEAVGDDEEVVVGEAVEVGAVQGSQGAAHDAAAAEEAHALSGEAGLVGEVEGLEAEGGVGELSD